MFEDLRFKRPFTFIISGTSGSGKSSFCIKLLQNLESLSTETRFEGDILWCHECSPTCRRRKKNTVS